VMYQEATRLGLEVSDTEVAREILRIDAFRDEEGAFDKRIYSSTLRQLGYNQTDFEEKLRRDLLREKLRRLVFFGATISEPMVLEYYRRSSTRLDLEYVRVRPSSFTAEVEISEESRATWLEENAEIVQAEYEEDFQRLYDVPEKVALSVIRFDILQDGLGAAELLPRAKGVLAELQEGADFAELARRWSEHPSAVDGGRMDLAAVPQLEQEVVGAIEDLGPGALTPVVTTDDALAIYRLDERQEAHVIPFEEVRDDIADRLYRDERAPGLAAEYADRLLADWSTTGAAPLSVLEERGLSLSTTGPIAPTPYPGLFNPPARMLKDAESATVGEVLPDVYEASGVLWVGRLVERIDPDMDLYALEQEAIREQTLMVRRGELYESWITDLVAQADIR